MDDSEYSKSYKTLKQVRFKYHALLTRNLTHDAYVNTKSLLRRPEKINHTDDVFASDFNMNKDVLNISLPYPYSKPTKHKKLIDPCMCLLNEKAAYKKKMKTYAKDFKRRKYDFKEDKLQKIHRMNIPKYLLDLCSNQIRDPDTHFSGYYNWYYTGNSLAVIEHENEKFLVRPNASDNLCFTSISNKTNMIGGIEDRHPIYSLNYSNISGKNCINIRQKHAIDITKYSIVNNEVQLSSVFQYNSEDVPLIDGKFNKDVSNKLGVLDLDRNFYYFDVVDKDKEDVCSIEKLCELSDDLMQFEYVDANNIVVMDRKYLHMLDTRANNINNSIKLQSGYFVCDDLCSFLMSKRNDNYAFVISVHNLLKVDLRQQKVVKQWSHLLKHAPYIIHSFLQNSDEHIVFSSQNEASKGLLIDNYRENNICKHIPTNMDTLRKANLKKVTISDDIPSRLSLSTVGITTIPDSSTMVFANSYGDLFANDLVEYEDDDIYSVDRLLDWVENTPRKSKELIVSNFREMTEAMKSLDRCVLMDRITKFTSRNRRLETFYEKHEKEFTMGMIWDEENSFRNALSTSINPSNKVSQWLNSL